MKKRIAVLGLGHIGEYVRRTLFVDRGLEVHGFDLSNGHDLTNADLVDEIVKQHDALVASTPFFLNKLIAKKCALYNKAYFDLTESNEVTDYIKTLSTMAPMVTQCGLAPGMVSVIANDIASKFKTVKSIAIRVGAIPALPNNHMGYNLTWNTEGLINEYIHPCKAVIDGKFRTVDPLEGLEQINFDGINLEAANTSGGIGTLAETWEGKADSVTYKTLRYPGHWAYMKFLKDDMNLKANFNKFVEIFNNSVPHTEDDRVFVLIKVIGSNGGSFMEEKNYSKIITNFDDITAIQISTASGIMAAVDIWAKGHLYGLKGLIRQEQLPAGAMLNSPYTACYR